MTAGHEELRRWITIHGRVDAASIERLNRDIMLEGASPGERVSTANEIRLTCPIPPQGRYTQADISLAFEDAGEPLVRQSVRDECQDHVLDVTASIDGETVSIINGQLAVDAQVSVITEAREGVA